MDLHRADSGGGAALVARSETSLPSTMIGSGPIGETREMPTSVNEEIKMAQTSQQESKKMQRDRQLMIPGLTLRNRRRTRKQLLPGAIHQIKPTQ